MTEINSHTKIAAILKKDVRALDALTALTPRFEKLRNPLLRRLMAGRTTLSQAAQVGGCSIKEIAEALKPLGFVFTDDGKVGTGASASLPGFIKYLDEKTCEVLDVRQDLAEGKDPLKKIMAVVKDLPSDRVLKLVNTFEPTPLIHLLEKKGYESFVKTISGDEVHTYFKLRQASKKNMLRDEAPETVPEEVFRNKLNSFGEQVQSVDVSNMEMPLPMVTILEALSTLPEGYALSVQHKRIPVFLFNELKERNFDYLLYPAAENDVKLLIFHKG